MDLIASTYSCPTDFTDFHRFRLHASFVLTNPCHPCHLWTLLSPIILVPRIPRVLSPCILCPTYLCNLCHLWALLPPIILVPKIHSFHRFRLLASFVLLICVICVICGPYYLQLFLSHGFHRFPQISSPGIPCPN